MAAAIANKGTKTPITVEEDLESDRLVEEFALEEASFTDGIGDGIGVGRNVVGR